MPANEIKKPTEYFGNFGEAIPADQIADISGKKFKQDPINDLVEGIIRMSCEGNVFKSAEILRNRIAAVRQHIVGNLEIFAKAKREAFTEAMYDGAKNLPSVDVVGHALKGEPYKLWDEIGYYECDKCYKQAEYGMSDASGDVEQCFCKEHIPNSWKASLYL